MASVHHDNLVAYAAEADNDSEQFVFSDYATCNDCPCYPDDNGGGSTTCPANIESTLQTEFTTSMINTMKSMKLLNPISIKCDDVSTATNCRLNPPQPEDISGEEAVCAYKLVPNENEIDENDDSNNSTCSNSYSYELKTFESKLKAEQNLHVVTHYGTCGVCSTLQDLATYILNTDMTSIGIDCAFRGLANITDGIQCYKNVGYTNDCSVAWLTTSFLTNIHCGNICREHAVLKKPNNKPNSPNCELADCILCDEINTGPFFKKYAARTRRNSGLTSLIVRNCTEIITLKHLDPCDYIVIDENNDSNATFSLTLPPTMVPTTSMVPTTTMPSTTTMVEPTLPSSGSSSSSSSSVVFQLFLLSCCVVMVTTATSITM